MRASKHYLHNMKERHWFSGKIPRCQRGAPGSIPGWRISAFVAQLAARGSHNPKVAGSIPVESSCSLPVSLGGQDTRLSPERPGFNSRSGNFFSYRCLN